eukprot:TRINITY_DN360_c0_g1_i3.p1 TRINITY_DN360_c0_g1~~TRINITY_DN360_c0_g1_i3.p1  ORF type:complete len:328 (-),score=115.57 TRINITY_DN360_c0_g1_i3:181-1164(-)
MGNLVSNRTWEHFWMNEGFTVFLERKIMGRLHGEQFRQLHAMNGWQALKESIDDYGAEHAFTALVPCLQGVDPDDAFSSLPYEKGFTFLQYLEDMIGGPELMEKYLKVHCQKYQLTTVDTEEWKQFFLEFCRSHGVAEDKLATIDWQSWLYGVGLPPVLPRFDTTLADQAHALADLYLTHLDQPLPPAPEAVSLQSWKAAQILVFLDRLEALEQCHLQGSGDVEATKAALAQRLAIIDAHHGLSNVKNAEIKFAWCKLRIRADMEEAFTQAIAFITSQGRMKFVRPLYRELYRNPKSRELALAAFSQHRDSYHSICAKMLAKDLQLE